MLIVFCGEDSASSRKDFQKALQVYRDKNYEIQHIDVSEVEDIYKNAEGVVNLFGQEQIYTVTNVSSKYKGRSKTPFKEALQALAKDKKIILLDWEEDKSAYDLSTLKRIASEFYESKAEKSIFELLDSIYPGNINSFIGTLRKVAQTQPDTFIFAMIAKHIRKLILAQENVLPGNIPSWQKGKLHQQASNWSENKLIGFYEGLANIDEAQKTGTSTFNLIESIELLACYYLK